MKLADAYAARRPNFLNVIRLMLAVGVIFWHSYAVTGSALAISPQVAAFLGSVFVDGFFAVSGFLIVRSWGRMPSAGSFLTARVLRIFPAFWACLLVTALAFAPVSVILAGAGGSVLSLDNALYVVKNFGLWIFQYGVDGTLQDVAYPGVWNGSLWTLAWEFMCYLAVLLFGMLGLWARRWPALAVFGVLWLATFFELDEWLSSDIAHNALRFALVFLTGCLFAQFQDRIRLTWLGVLSSLIVLAASVWLPDYRLLGAPALAYALLAVGGLVSNERLALRNDISYGVYIYAFPVQQLLAILAVANDAPLWFGVLATVLTLPLAVLSWVCIERPALRLKAVLTRATRARQPA